jgi:hypothetical protein
MLNQAHQVFQVEVGLGGNIFSQSFEAFGQFGTHGFFKNLWELLHRYYSISMLMFMLHYSMNMTVC